ncbi:anti-sigma factor domain-containing protein [Bacillus daqingensis]|uniref:Anti-sigma-W factor RsiW n=1 Tax=Bacillus daqingensis TaxID=872396 RepID=A0ABV9NX65_9BACI
MSSTECHQLIDYFNREMNEQERRDFEQHLETCASCREELQEWEELAGELPFMSAAAEPPEGMKDRILGTVFEEETKEEMPPPGKQPAELEEKMKKKRGIPVWALGLTAAALLLSVSGNIFQANDRQQLAEETSLLEEERQELVFERDLLEADYEELAAQLEEQDGVSDVLLASALSPAGEGFQGEGSATIISENGHIDLVIQVSNMPQLEGTEAFQAWVIEGETPVPAGSFTIDENGNGAVTYRLTDMEDTQIDQIAISLEPQPNSLQPEGEILLASQ